MESAIHILIKRLRKHSWGSESERWVEDTLRRVVGDAANIRQEIQQWSADSKGWVSDHAVETGTHYKWELARGKGFESWRVFVHRFKRVTAASYAAVPHNHRCAFASALLRGGFTHCVLAEPRLDAVVTRTPLTAGQAYSLRAEPFHYLEGVEGDTMTLVVTLPPARRFSESMDPHTGELRRHHPVCNMSIFP